MPAPVGPQIGDDLARLQREVDARKHLRPGAVREAHPLEGDSQRPDRQLGGMRRLGDRLDPAQPGEAARRRRRRTLCEREDPAERLERPDQLQQQLVEEEELAVGQRAADHVAAAEQHDGADREGRQEEQAGQERSLDARLAQHAVAHSFRLAGKARLHVVLAAERLHHLDPDDRLVGRFGDVCLQLLHLTRDRHDLAAEREREQPDGRHRDSAISASFTLTRQRTTAIPKIIISDWMPWVSPQPMK